MLTGILFIFLFPILAVTLMAFPLLIVMKRKSTGGFWLYESSGLILASLVGLALIGLLNSSTSQSITLGVSLTVALVIYGSILGARLRHLSKTERRNENERT